MAAKKNSKYQSKASFVRSLPTSLSAADVVEEAKAAGFALDVGYVYNIRSTAKSSGKAKGARQTTNAGQNGAPATSSGAASRRGPDSSSVESLLKAIGAELGLASAIRILEAERARVHAVLRK